MPEKVLNQTYCWVIENPLRYMYRTNQKKFGRRIKSWLRKKSTKDNQKFIEKVFTQHKQIIIQEKQQQQEIKQKEKQAEKYIRKKVRERAEKCQCQKYIKELIREQSGYRYFERAPSQRLERRADKFFEQRSKKKVAEQQQQQEEK